MEIVLIRHGKPEAAAHSIVSPIVNAIGYVKWVKQYHASKVSINSRPSGKCMKQYKDHFVIASDLNRAIHSAKIFTSKTPAIIDKNLREMELPRYKLPLYLPAMVWLYLSRILWLMGCKGSFETYKQSKIRSIKAAFMLIKMAEKEKKVIVFGHGLINRFIRQVLIKKGWQLTTKNSDYWGVTVLTLK